MEYNLRYTVINMTVTTDLRFKQGVTLTGCNTTGPLRAAPGKLRCICAALQTTTDDDDRRRQTPGAKQYWPIRRASNKVDKSSHFYHYFWKYPLCKTSFRIYIFALSSMVWIEFIMIDRLCFQQRIAINYCITVSNSWFSLLHWRK